MLDEDHYDLDKVKERIVEYLAVRKLKGDLKGPILCFVGPPGVGKTSLGQSIARAMNRKFVRISLGGVRDEAEIRGHRRTYIGSMPGRLVQALQAGRLVEPGADARRDRQGLGRRPGRSGGGAARSARPGAEPLVPRSLPRDPDRSVAACCSSRPRTSSARSIPALLDRMEIITLSGYTEDEKVHIAKMYLIPRQLEEHGLKPRAARDHRRGAAPGHHRIHARSRRAHRSSGRSARSRARSRRAWRPTPRTPRRVDAPQVPDYLGPARFRSEAAFRTSRPGVATGVAWTEAGGDVLFIEAVLLPGGNGHLTLTGQLGNVMQESARAALSHVRQQARRARHHAGDADASTTCTCTCRPAPFPRTVRRPA